MSRKYPKKVRQQFKRQQAAAAAFVGEWMNSGLASTLITDYSCTLGCDEAKTYAGLMRAFGYVSTAEAILADHGEDCDNPNEHGPWNVWTFSFELMGYDDCDGWTIVADGKTRVEAEEVAYETALESIKKTYPDDYAKRELALRNFDIEEGIPTSTALYSWIDARLVDA